MKDYNQTLKALQDATECIKQLQKGQEKTPIISFEEGIEDTGGKCPTCNDRELVHAIRTLRRWMKKGNRSFLLLVDDEKIRRSIMDFGGDYQNIYNSLVDACSCDRVFKNLVKKALKNAD